MKVTAQLYSNKGPFGPMIKFNINILSKLAPELFKRIDEFPDKFEGAELIDWTSLDIHVSRK